MTKKKIIKWVILDGMGDYVSDEGYPTNHPDRAIVCDTRADAVKELAFWDSHSSASLIDCRIVEAWQNKSGDWIELEEGENV